MGADKDTNVGMGASESVMSKVPVLEQIRNSKQLLSLPQAISEILEEVHKEDFSADSLARIILKDPSLTSRILKLANSSFYHRLTEIKTVNQAVSILGVTTVKCLALSSSIFHPDKVAAESGVDPKTFFAGVLSVASAAEKIAKAVEYSSSDEAFIAGLLHDIGIMYFLHHHPKEYSRIVSGEVTAGGLVEAELQVFEASHCEVGAHLADEWRLPEYVVGCIREHHNAVGRDGEDQLQRVVALAVLLSGDNFCPYQMRLEERLGRIKSLTSALGLDKERVDEISSSMMADTICVAEYLGVDIGNIEEMLVTANQEIWRSYITIENLFKERQELSRSLLKEERAKGAVEAKNVAMATLSHYLNNATMVIYGRTQLIRMSLARGDRDRLLDQIPADLELMDQAIAKIVAVLEEMKAISPMDKREFYHVSKAMNLDDRIRERLEAMARDGTLRIGQAEEPVT